MRQGGVGAEGTARRAPVITSRPALSPRRLPHQPQQQNHPHQSHHVAGGSSTSTSAAMGCRDELADAASFQGGVQHCRPTGVLKQPGRETGKPFDRISPKHPWGHMLTRYVIFQRQQQQQQPAAKKPEDTDSLKLKKAWEIAMGPSKQLPMNAIMMYMSGNSLQIFSIMMVFMLFKGPIQGLINTNAVFAKYDTETTHARMLGVKAVYVLMQLALLALGIWKVNAMGLLPYGASFSVGHRLELTSSPGLRDQIGWHGSRNGSLWNGLTLP